jgi:hypothetical protein
MKKSILLFVIGATTLAAGLVGCKTKECENPTGFSGTFNGTHKVFIGAADLAALNLVTPIADVIVGSVSGTTVTIGSDILPIDLTGTISASNSNIVNLDSLILGAGDTIRIPSGIAPNGTLKIYDLRAGGTGTLDCKTLTTSLKVKAGKTNLGAIGPFDLSNLATLNLELRGTFTKP